MTKSKIYGLLGIAAKAGKVFGGEYSATEKIRGFNAKLVIIAKDASDNTKDRFISMGRGYKSTVYGFGTKSLLGNCIGKAERAVLVITDEGLAKAAKQLLQTESEAELYDN